MTSLQKGQEMSQSLTPRAPGSFLSISTHNQAFCSSRLTSSASVNCIKSLDFSEANNLNVFHSNYDLNESEIERRRRHQTSQENNNVLDPKYFQRSVKDLLEEVDEETVDEQLNCNYDNALIAAQRKEISKLRDYVDILLEEGTKISLENGDLKGELNTRDYLENMFITSIHQKESIIRQKDELIQQKDELISSLISVRKENNKNYARTSSRLSLADNTSTRLFIQAQPADDFEQKEVLTYEISANDDSSSRSILHKYTKFEKAKKSSKIDAAKVKYMSAPDIDQLYSTVTTVEMGTSTKSKFSFMKKLNPLSLIKFNTGNNLTRKERKGSKRLNTERQFRLSK